MATIENGERRKKLSALLLFSCFAISLFPMGLSAPTYWSVDSNWDIYNSTQEGPIRFASNIRTTQIHFQDGYSRFSNFQFNSSTETWSDIGFQASNNANITITSADENEINYTVNAPPGNTSTSRLYTPGMATPQSVTGATLWAYDEVTDILTVKATHSSPVLISVSWWVSGATSIEIINSFPTLLSMLIGVAVVFTWLGWRSETPGDKLAGAGLGFLFWGGAMWKWTVDNSSSSDVLFSLIFLAPMLVCMAALWEAIFGSWDKYVDGKVNPFD